MENSPSATYVICSACKKERVIERRTLYGSIRPSVFAIENEGGDEKHICKMCVRRVVKALNGDDSE
jgi:hypothetical protein